VPYFEPWEMKDRVTYYERNYGLNQFIFATPFTLTGKSHADSLKDQYKRKTILTVENQFPYVKKRLLVVNKHEIQLTPLENAIEGVESRIEALQSEIRCNPPNPKTLQSVLQGSILATVNVGPREIAKTFLGKDAKDYPSEQIDRLRSSLMEFVKACEDAVAVNKTLIGPDQLNFQTELEQGCNALSQFMREIIQI